MAIDGCGRHGCEGFPGRRDEFDRACRFVEVLVSVGLGIDIAELRAAGRGRAPAAFARQTAMYLAHVHFGLNLSEVGKRFGRDRTTVAHACARVEDSRDDPKVEQILKRMELLLDRWERGIQAIGAKR